MLELHLEEQEFWSDSQQMFIYMKPQTLRLEHSLLSLSKWEATWKKPFLSETGHSPIEERDYVRCMTVNKQVDPTAYMALTPDHMQKIRAYINDPHTATWFSNAPGGAKGTKEAITSELIYYWMVSMNIPFECQKWHLNNLLTLIHVISVKSDDSKKMSPSQVAHQNAALNAARKARLKTRG